MAITTTDSIKTPKPRLCSRCGHPSSLMTKDPNGDLHCFDECPTGPAPEPEPVLIAHDPLNPENHADIRALERLRKLGRGLTLEKQTLSPTTGVKYKSEVLELDTDKLRQQMARPPLLDVGGGSDDVAMGGPSIQPLSASNRKAKVELEIDWTKAGIDKGA